MQACRSPEFLQFAAPMIRNAYSAIGPEWEEENLARLYTKVEKGFIRVDADEVTYPAHVILRFDLERAAISESQNGGFAACMERRTGKTARHHSTFRPGRVSAGHSLV